MFPLAFFTNRHSFRRFYAFSLAVQKKELEYLDASEDDRLGLKVDAAAHRVDDRVRLFEDLLLHERVVVPLHDLLDLHFQRRDLAVVGVVGVAVQPVDAQRALLHGRNVIILQVP